MRLRRLAIAAVVVLGALVFTGSAQACSCPPMEPREAMRRADAAIVGRLVEVVPRSQVQADYRYRVQRVYKQGRGLSEGQVVSVRSSMQSAACGLPKRTGRRYGLFLLRRESRWTGGLCGTVKPRLLRSATASAGNRLAGAGSDCAS